MGSEVKVLLNPAMRISEKSSEAETERGNRMKLGSMVYWRS